MKNAIYLLNLVEKVMSVGSFPTNDSAPPSIKEEPSLNSTPDPGLSNPKSDSWKDSISGTGIQEEPALARTNNGSSSGKSLAKNQVKGNKYSRTSGTGLASPVLNKWTQSKVSIDEEPKMKNGTAHGKGLGKNQVKGASY